MELMGLDSERADLHEPIEEGELPCAQALVMDAEYGKYPALGDRLVIGAEHDENPTYEDMLVIGAEYEDDPTSGDAIVMDANCGNEPPSVVIGAESENDRPSGETLVIGVERMEGPPSGEMLVTGAECREDFPSGEMLVTGAECREDFPSGETHAMIAESLEESPSVEMLVASVEPMECPPSEETLMACAEYSEDPPSGETLVMVSERNKSVERNAGVENLVDNIESEDEEDSDNEDEEEEDEEAEGDEMVSWTDAEDDEEDDAETLKPVRSKNELMAPLPVATVTATLQPHHQLLPVGLVSSIVGKQVIVEGVVVHNPLNEGSVLWITELRIPLGLVDEIFGPVKNPFYIVRYNSESEVPASLQIGSKVSFVNEFACHVLSDGNLYKKGYDASGEHDEEISDDGEFSDDEKEAEFRKLLKMSKKGRKTGKSKNMDNKIDRNRNEKWNRGNQGLQSAPSQETQKSRTHLQKTPNKSDQNSYFSREGFRAGLDVPQFPPLSSQTSIGVGGFPNLQPQNPTFPCGLPIHDLVWPLLNQFQQHSQIPMLNNLAFQQQFGANQLPIGMLQGGQLMNFHAPALLHPDISSISRSVFGSGFQGQASASTSNPVSVGTVDAGGMAINQALMQQNFISPPVHNPGIVTSQLPFNMGMFPPIDNNSKRRSGHSTHGKGRPSPGRPF